MPGIRDVWTPCLWYDNAREIDLEVCISIISMLGNDYQEELSMGEHIVQKIISVAQDIAKVIAPKNTTIALERIFLPQLLMVEVAYAPNNKDVYELFIQLKSNMIVGPNAKINKKDNLVVYKMKSYTIYSGPDNFGHYQASVKRGNGWYLCDDTSSICEISAGHIPISTGKFFYKVLYDFEDTQAGTDDELEK